MLKTDEYSNKVIKVNKISFILYGTKNSWKASAVKIGCEMDGSNVNLYYIFKKDISFYKDIRTKIIGCLNIQIYNDSVTIKSLGSKLDKKVNL